MKELRLTDTHGELVEFRREQNDGCLELAFDITFLDLPSLKALRDALTEAIAEIEGETTK